MSLAGLKKQLNKANQYLSETIGGAKGTELDPEFAEMERKVRFHFPLETVSEFVRSSDAYEVAEICKFTNNRRFA